ncbi:MAG: hypothetical protein FWG26_05205 [Betaproteobacteria bacterium]|nr:hypothetical protein [Betaproteobacteria bacterium]
MNIPLMISIFVSILLCLRPILLPQFTVTAGLLAIDGILFVYLYRQNNDGFYLLLAGLFACLSFSLRSQQFFLVLLVSFPLVLSKNLLFRGKFIKFVLFIIVVCLALSVTDYRVKNSPELKEFTQFHYKMAAATDFGYTHKLIESPEILEKYGYTINDIRLMDSYFYVTDKYTDTTSIDKMINEVGFSEKLDVQQGIAALRAFFDPSILPLVFLGFVLIVLLPLSRKQRLVIISILFLISGLFFSIGAIGRPGRLRMYFPIAVVILLCPLILACFDKLKSKNTLLIVSISSFVCCLFAIKYMHDIAIYNTLWSRQVRQDIKNLPVNEPIFSWGAAFPFEAAYPLFGNWQEFQRYDVRLFGGYTSAPFCKETTIFGAGFLDLMHSRNGVLTLEWNRGGCVILKTFAQEWQLGCQIQCEHQGIIRPNRNIIRVQCE